MSALGKLAYHAVHRPLGIARQSWKDGGPIEQYRTAAGHRAMRAAAAAMPPLVEPPAGPSARIAYLSGERFWDQTLFCFVSLQQVCPFRIDPLIHDDGTLDAQVRAAIHRVVPWARFVTSQDIAVGLDRRLPASRFPALRARRIVYPHLRKLTDIHALSSGWTLVADSDMLFFRSPDAIIDWFERPQPLYIRDIATAYGYPLNYLDRLAGSKVPEAINVGLYALDSSAIDWARVEHWCAAQLQDQGSHYLQEQALTAMLFAGKAALALPRADYVVMPDTAEGMDPKAILHHYVAQSKQIYFRHGWRRILANARTTAD